MESDLGDSKFPNSYQMTTNKATITKSTKRVIRTKDQANKKDVD